MTAHSAPFPISLGFPSALPPPTEHELLVSGTLPRWLRGRYVHTGPAGFDFPRGKVNHWFDGLALLSSIEFDSGSAIYRSRPLESDAYEAAQRRQRPVFGEFDTEPPGPFHQLRSLFRPPLTTDNDNVNVADLGAQVIAMTETSRHNAFDPRTLETRGEVHYSDELGGQLSTAHPQIDRERNVAYNLLVRFGATCSYEFYQLPLGSLARRVVASLPTDRPSYTHSFGASEKFLVLVEVPLCVHPLAMRFSRRPFIERYVWRPERQTRVRVVSKEDGSLVASAVTAPFFAFHHVNAVERDGRVDVDLVAFPDATIVKELRLFWLRAGVAPPSEARLTRLPIRIGAFDQVVEPAVLSDERLEFPRITARSERRPYRYVYGIAGGFFEHVIRLDLEGGNTRRFEQPGWHANEPLFVQAPGTTGEDEGVVITIVLDATSGKSRVVVLDAQSLELIADAELPQRVPFYFHGQFFGEV